MSDSGAGRRARKSAPVKNAVSFVPMNRRRRLRDVGNRSNSEVVCETPLHSIDEDSQKEVRTRQRGRLNGPGARPRMSTPMKRDRSSLKRVRPRRSCVPGSSESNKSLEGLPNVLNRRYNPDYDPYIEIRRARERLSQYKTEGDWTADMLLGDDAEKDLKKYEEKMKRRCSLRSDFSGELELERRPLELLRRQRDIDTGKVTDKYAEYVLTVPKPEREKHNPRTPNKFRLVSRRAWDGMIKKWRKHLHNIGNPDFNETWRSLASTDTSMSSSAPPSPSPHSDIENANGGGDMLLHPTSRMEADTGLESTETTGAPVVATGAVQWRKAVGEHGDEEEDTMQPATTTVVVATEAKRSKKKSGPPGMSSDDETVHASDARYSLRGRSSATDDCQHAPTADVLHSGLTNDVMTLGVRRDDLDFGAICEMLSPKKRTRNASDRYVSGDDADSGGGGGVPKQRRFSGRLKNAR